MKRLIITGIPCSSQSWEEFFPPEKTIEQKIICFIDIFSDYYYQNMMLSDLVPFVSDVILRFKPDQIILHDISVLVGILALIAANKKNDSLHQNIIIFNGAFKGFDVRKSNHPIRIQTMTFQEFENEVKIHGGTVDPKYKNHFLGIKHFYQQIVDISNKSTDSNKSKNLSHIISQKDSKIDLRGEVLIIASRNDPYIHFECLEILSNMLANCELKVINYGHFPYSSNTKLLKEEVDRFQTIHSNQIKKIRAKL